MNKRSTRVELVWDVRRSRAPTDAQRERLLTALESRLDSRGRLRIVVDEERTQSRNREIAVGRLNEIVAAALRVRRARRPTRPSAASAERRVESKKARSRVKRDRARPTTEPE